MKEKPTIDKGGISVAAKIERLKEVASSDNQEQYLNNDVIPAEVEGAENEAESQKSRYTPIIPPCEMDSALQGISITVLPESEGNEEKSLQVVELSVVKRALYEVLNERQRIRQQGSKRKRTTPPVVSAVIDVLLVIIVMAIVFLVGTYL
ncbi:MAG: hypothetical protein ACI4DP_03220 [Candidatus Ornithomonoglobus sp.]